MTLPEFSNEFDVLYANIASNGAPGIDEYEKSVFLTKAEKMIVRRQFDPVSDQLREGFDGSQQRQYDFSTLIRTEELVNITNSIDDYNKTDKRSSVFVWPKTCFLALNEILDDFTGNSYTVTPITYSRYTLLMSKPYQYPPKRVAWRLMTNNSISLSKANVTLFGDIEYKLYYNKNFANKVEGLFPNESLEKTITIHFTEVAKDFPDSDFQIEIRDIAKLGNTTANVFVDIKTSKTSHLYKSNIFNVLNIIGNSSKKRLCYNNGVFTMINNDYYDSNSALEHNRELYGYIKPGSPMSETDVNNYNEALADAVKRHGNDDEGAEWTVPYNETFLNWTIEYNNQLEGAILPNVALTEEQASAFNSEFELADSDDEYKSSGDTLTEEESYEYNVTLPGAIISNGRMKTLNDDWELISNELIEEYNATLTGAKQEDDELTEAEAENYNSKLDGYVVEFQPVFSGESYTIVGDSSLLRDTMSYSIQYNNNINITVENIDNIQGDSFEFICKESNVFDEAHTIVEIIGRFCDSNGELSTKGIKHYKLRYVKEVPPIVLVDLTEEGLSIDGVSEPNPCALPPECHQEIVELAVSLAKVAMAGSTETLAANAQQNNRNRNNNNNE